MAKLLIKTGTQKAAGWVGVGVGKLQEQREIPRNRFLKSDTISNYHWKANKSKQKKTKSKRCISKANVIGKTSF